jgi:DNA-binding beta-propeller fold protein YncE
VATFSTQGTVLLDQRRSLIVTVSAGDAGTERVINVTEHDAASGVLRRSHQMVVHQPDGIGSASETSFATLATTRGTIFAVHAPFQVGTPPPGWVDVIDERTLTLRASTRLGLVPLPPVLDEQTGRVFIANERSGTVSIFSAASGALLRTTTVSPVPLDPSGSPIVDEKTGRVFFAENRVPGRVAMLDAQSGVLLRNIGVTGAPVAAALDVAAGRVLVVMAGPVHNTVGVLDTRTGAVLQNGALPWTPTGIVVDPKTHRGFVTYGDSTQVSVLDSTTGSLLLSTRVRADVENLSGQLPQATPQPGAEQPPSIARLDSTRGWVIVTVPIISDDDGTEVGSEQLAVLDGRTGSVIHVVPTVSSAWPNAIAVDDTHGRAYVNVTGLVEILDVSCIKGEYVFANTDLRVPYGSQPGWQAIVAGLAVHIPPQMGTVSATPRSGTPLPPATITLPLLFSGTSTPTPAPQTTPTSLPGAVAAIQSTLPSPVLAGGVAAVVALGGLVWVRVSRGKGRVPK